jgi:GWxTD domain-containing protein
VKLEEPGLNQVISRKVSFRITESVAPDLSLPMSETDIKRYRDQMKFFATKNELELYDKLNLPGKANFVLEFWRSRDDAPETPENEFMLESFRRMNYAEENFKADKGGLNSDMGRVFVIYGRPDDIERYSMALRGKPYEIWHYYSVLGGAHDFVFVDRNNSGIFNLVHSTVESEIHNYDWLEQEVN